MLVSGYFLIQSVKREVQLRESLQIANEGQSNLIHIINHQIKGYLAKGRSIFSEVNSGDYGAVSPQSKLMLDAGFNALSEGVNFVEGVLNSSSVENGTMRYSMAQFNVSDTLKDVSDKQEGNAAEKKLEYRADIEPGITMNGDMLQLKEAFKNLIDNSIHYTPSGFIHVELKKIPGTSVNIAKHITATTSKMQFTVEDSGVGIAPEDRIKLFTKGGRGKESLTLNVNSTGFGLSFVKCVVEAHNGTVRVESEGKGKGSKFIVEIPLA